MCKKTHELGLKCENTYARKLCGVECVKDQISWVYYTIITPFTFP